MAVPLSVACRLGPPLHLHERGAKRVDPDPRGRRKERKAGQTNGRDFPSGKRAVLPTLALRPAGLARSPWNPSTLVSESGGQVGGGDRAAASALSHGTAHSEY